VRFIGESSLRPILITGNANAQKKIGIPIIKKKYFSAKVLFELFFTTADSFCIRFLLIIDTSKT
jgi:hypothetical protein